MNYSEIRQAARATLKGYWLRAIAAWATVQGVGAIVSLCIEAAGYAVPDFGSYLTTAAVGSVVGALLTAPLTLGFKRMLWCRSVGQAVSVATIFDLFGSAKRLFKYYLLVLLKGVIVYAPFVFSAVPLCVISYLTEKNHSFTGDLEGLFSLVIMLFLFTLLAAGTAATVLFAVKLFISDYVLINDPDLGVVQTLRRSWELTGGRIGNVLIFVLSFIPWLLLGLTGFGNLYVQPYFECSSAIFARLIINSAPPSAETAEYQAVAEGE